MKSESRQYGDLYSIIYDSFDGDTTSLLESDKSMVSNLNRLRIKFLLLAHSHNNRELLLTISKETGNISLDTVHKISSQQFRRLIDAEYVTEENIIEAFKSIQNIEEEVENLMSSMNVLSQVLQEAPLIVRKIRNMFCEDTNTEAVLCVIDRTITFTEDFIKKFPQLQFSPLQNLPSFGDMKSAEDYVVLNLLRITNVNLHLFDAIKSFAVYSNAITQLRRCNLPLIIFSKFVLRVNCLYIKSLFLSISGIEEEHFILFGESLDRNFDQTQIKYDVLLNESIWNEPSLIVLKNILSKGDFSKDLLSTYSNVFRSIVASPHNSKLIGAEILVFGACIDICDRLSHKMSNEQQIMRFNPFFMLFYNEFIFVMNCIQFEDSLMFLEDINPNFVSKTKPQQESIIIMLERRYSNEILDTVLKLLDISPEQINIETDIRNHFQMIENDISCLYICNRRSIEIIENKLKHCHVVITGSCAQRNYRNYVQCMNDVLRCIEVLLKDCNELCAVEASSDLSAQSSFKLFKFILSVVFNITEQIEIFVSSVHNEEQLEVEKQTLEIKQQIEEYEDTYRESMLILTSKPSLQEPMIAEPKTFTESLANDI
jgi:hypothetical protein